MRLQLLFKPWVCRGAEETQTLDLEAMAGICCSFAYQLTLSLALAACVATAMQPLSTHMLLGFSP